MLIAHRGYSAMYPENTMTSFRKARSKVIEFDVRKTLDNVPVVIHDRSLDRTTTGTGEIKKHTWEHIQNLHIKGGTERVPSLDQVLETFGDEYSYNIEIKSSDTASVVVDSIKKSSLPYGNTLVTSFKWDEIKTVRKLDDRINTGLISIVRPERAIRECVRLGCEVAVLNHLSITRDVVNYANERGIEVYAYTVNSVDEARKLIQYGVSGIISDECDLLGFTSFENRQQ
jgi:glycerophosphoryl diester phosphodiesterase